jgi:hypothetical protein
MKKICVTEYKQECYEATRTVYKCEWKEEAYTAYKTECVPEVRTRNVTCNKLVPEYHDEVRNCTKYVPTCEERTVMKPCWTTKEVVEICRKTVDQGHWECCEVERKPTCMERCHDRKNKDCCCKPVYTKTEKKWIPCPVCIETPVTKCVRVCTYVPEVVKVTVCKPVCYQETVKVCTYKCVQECKTETFTVMVSKCVPYPAVRKVAVSVPVIEKYTAVRLVPVCCEKWVPCCEPVCCKEKKHHGR